MNTIDTYELPVHTLDAPTRSFRYPNRVYGGLENTIGVLDRKAQLYGYIWKFAFREDALESCLADILYAKHEVPCRVAGIYMLQGCTRPALPSAGIVRIPRVGIEALSALIQDPTSGRLRTVSVVEGLLRFLTPQLSFYGEELNNSFDFQRKAMEIMHNLGIVEKEVKV